MSMVTGMNSAPLLSSTCPQSSIQLNGHGSLIGLSVATTATSNPSTVGSYGTRIGEDHENYVLMYDMLTGIRIAVSRNQAKHPKKIEESDFKAAHKLAFDVVGNEMTPSSKYDFKFKDYAPWIFRDLRETFRIDAAEYLISLTGKYVLSELGSPGKSGSFFYYSQDYRFIIKTIHHAEHLYLRRILRHYYHHVKNHPNTLLSRFIGLHRVKLPRGRKIHFVVMGNIFPPTKAIHEVYDIKGSTLGRQVSKDEIKANPRIVRKDINWLQSGKRLKLGPDKRAIFLEQLCIDERFLESMNIMDYSLLVGIHYAHRGGQETTKDRMLSIYQTHSDAALEEPSAAWPHRRSLVAAPSVGKSSSTTTINAGLTMLRCTIVESQASLAPRFSPLSYLGTFGPDDLPTERRYFRFYQEHGGFSSSDENNQCLEEVYFLGIIDILTPYNYAKKIEHAFKTLNYDRTVISAIKPSDYGKRFLAFIKRNVLLVDDQNRLLYKKLLNGNVSRPSIIDHSIARSKLSQSPTNSSPMSKLETASETLLMDHIGTSSSVSLLALSRSKAD